VALWVIESVGGSPRSWSGAKGGTNLSYKIRCKTKDGSKQPPRNSPSYADVELVQKESTPAPTAGQEIEGDVIEREWKSKDGEKSGKALKFEKPRSGFGGGGGGRAWKPRPDDSPMVYASRQASIGTQHSQDMAIRVVELAFAQDVPVEQLMEVLGVETKAKEKELGLVAAFQRQVNMAGATAWENEEKNNRIAGALAKLG